MPFDPKISSIFIYSLGYQSRGRKIYLYTESNKMIKLTEDPPLLCQTLPDLSRFGLSFTGDVLHSASFI